jgi:hypothetical protein
MQLSSRRSILGHSYFVKYVSFWYKILVKAAHFHTGIVTIDGGYSRVHIFSKIQLLDPRSDWKNYENFLKTDISKALRFTLVPHDIILH